MNNKGLSYVDWAISAGLFITYLVTLFILIGPSFVEDYSPEYLGGIIRDGVRDKLSIEITRYPAFLELEADPWPTGLQAKPFRFYLNNLPSEFSAIDPHQFIIYFEDYKIIRKSIDLTNNRLNFLENDMANLGVSSPPIDGKATIELSIFMTDSPIFEHTNGGTGLSTWPGTQNSIIGVGEKITGVYEDKFTSFFDTTTFTTDQIRENLNYPSGRDFNITIFEGTDLTAVPMMHYDTGVSPGEKDVVNTLVWSDWLIGADTPYEKTLITIMVKTW